MIKPRFYDVIAIVLYLLLGSFFVFFASNAFFCNVVNYVNKLNYPYVFATLPLFTLAIEVVAFLIFLVRFLRLDVIYRSHHIRTYCIHFFVYSCVGLLFSLIAMIVYKDPLFSNPFPGVLLVFLLIHLAIIIFVSICFFYSKKHPRNDSEERFIYGGKYCFYSALLGVFTFFAMNRFGAFIQSFFYMEYRHFWLTILFYLSLCAPLLMLVALINPMLGITSKEHYFKQENIVWFTFLGVNLATALYVIIVGINEPLLISLVSASMPLERLITFPIDAILLYGVNILLPIGRIIYIYKNRKVEE